MSSFFSLESPLYKFMNRLFEMLKLNVLWLLTGGVAEMIGLKYLLLVAGLDQYLYLQYVPLLFVGPATTAAFYITLRMSDEQEGYIAADYFRAYRQNFKQGMILGVIALVAIYAVWLDFQFYQASQSIGRSGMAYLVVGIITLVIVYTHLIYAFALQARYENTIVNTLRNSFSICLKFLPRTLLLLVVLAVVLAVFLWNYVTQFLGILVGPASLMLAISGIAVHAFRRIETENEERGKQEE